VGQSPSHAVKRKDGRDGTPAAESLARGHNRPLVSDQTSLCKWKATHGQ
jgi:hypothetical protein